MDPPAERHQNLKSSWQSLPLHLHISILQFVPLSTAKLHLSAVSRSWRALMQHDVHDATRDWHFGESLAVRATWQPGRQLLASQQIRSLILRSVAGLTGHAFDLSILAAGILALHLSEFDHVLVRGSASATRLQPASRLQGKRPGHVSSPMPASHQEAARRGKSAHPGMHKSPSPQHAASPKRQRPTVDLAVTIALPQPPPIAASLTTLVISTQHLSRQIFSQMWPCLTTLVLNFLHLDSTIADACGASALRAEFFPQLQNLAFGNSAIQRGQSDTFCSEEPSPSASDVAHLCLHLSSFPKLQRVVTSIPDWEIMAVPAPPGCSVSIGNCAASYRGCSGVRCLFSLRHLNPDPLTCVLLTHLRLRLFHRVGVPLVDPHYLDLGPLQGCTRLQQLIIAVEAGLTHAWCITGLEKLPADSCLAVHLCPISHPPRIVSPDGSGLPRNVQILQLGGPPC